MVEIIPNTYSGGILLIVVSILTFLCIVLCILFYRRSNLQPIRGRFPRQSLFLVFILLAMNVALTAFDEFQIECIWKYVFGTSLSFNVVLVVLLRGVHIFSVYEEAQEVTSAPRGIYKEIQRDKSGRSIFIRYARLLQSSTFQLSVFVVIATLQTLLYLIFYFVSTSSNPCEEIESFILSAAVGLVYIVLTVLLVWRMRPLQDGLFLKTELKFLGYDALIAVPTWAILGSLIGDEAGNIVLVCASFAAVIIVVGLPLMKSYTWESGIVVQDSDIVASDEETIRKEEINMSNMKNPEKFKRNTKLYNLDYILHSDDGFDTFKRYLTLEFSHENILFYDDATRFSEKYSNGRGGSDEMIMEANEIYKRYIEHGANLEVNLPSSQVTAFQEALNVNPPNASLILEVMNSAMSEIYNLMMNDPFPRFLRHKLYREFALRAQANSV